MPHWISQRAVVTAFYLAQGLAAADSYRVELNQGGCADRDRDFVANIEPRS
jgi:hypothetical protein